MSLELDFYFGNSCDANKSTLYVPGYRYLVHSCASDVIWWMAKHYCQVRAGLGPRLQRHKCQVRAGLGPRLLWVKRKVSRGIAILCKARRLLKASTLIPLYYSFIYPYFIYCIAVWGHTCDKFMSSLFKVQKRGVKIITSSSYLDHTLPIFSQNLKKYLTSIIFITVLIFMLKHKKGLLPSIFNELNVFVLCIWFCQFS